MTTFRSLHAPGRVLLLPNAWDAGSARLIEARGAPAIATTSAGLAWSRGYPDGDRLPQGVLASDGAAMTRIEGMKVEAVDATGAGDCFCGAALARLAAGDGLVEAARYANAAAALATTGYGAVAPIPRPPEVAALLRR